MRLVVLTIALILPSLPNLAFGLGIEATAGFTQLDDNSYHFLSYRVAVGGELAKNRRWSAHVGITHPYFAHGFSQMILRGGATHDWSLLIGGSSLSAFAGIGPGVYVDRVVRGGNVEASWVPAVVLQGGLRWGGKRFGALFLVDDYSGVYDLFDLPWVIWSQFTYSLGVYVAF